jgi:HEPN domain-containing protein
MLKGEIETAKQWIAKADSDLLNADNNLKSEKIPFDTVCFHCQQAAEKILKAYLIANQKPYPITHDLFLLLEQIIQFDSDAERLRDTLALLAPYAVEIRYPDDYFMPTTQDASEARRAAAEVYEWLKSVCPAIFLD